MTKNGRKLPEHSHAVPRKRTDEADAAFNQTQPLDPRAILQRAALAPQSLRPADILRLQQTIGNRAVARLLSQLSPARSLIQAKLTVNAPGDRQEADRVAEEVMATPAVQRAELEGDNEKGDEDEKPGVMTKPQPATVAGGAFEAGDEFEQQSSVPAQLRTEALPRYNDTGLPDRLKSGIEALSGLSMDNVNVHYNSSQPARLNALAYTQGRDIHVAPGQERHLPHEAWHVVQQKQGRVAPTLRIDGVAVNDDQRLEQEAQTMGRMASHAASPPLATVSQLASQSHRENPGNGAIQRREVKSKINTIIKTEEHSKQVLQEMLQSNTFDEENEKQLREAIENMEYDRQQTITTESLPSSSSMSTAMSSAIEQRNAYKAMEFINQGEKLDAEDDNGDTALHRVIKKLQEPSESVVPDPNFIDLAKLLIAKKPDLLDKQNKEKETPLDLIIKRSAPSYELTPTQIKDLFKNPEMTLGEQQLNFIKTKIMTANPTDDKSLTETVKSVVPGIRDGDLKLITKAAKREPTPTKGERKVITYVWGNVINDDKREKISPSLSTKLKGAIVASEKHKEFKENLRLAKQQNAPKQPDNAPKQPIKLIDIWEKHIYVNVPSNQDSTQIENSVSQLKTRLQEIYEQSKILGPVMDVATYAMRGGHDRSFSKQKELNIYIIDPKALASKSGLDKGGGVYPFENGIFIDYGLLEEPNKIVGVILHEITHFVVNEVFKNKALPYFSHQESQDYKEVMKQTAERNKEFSEMMKQAAERNEAAKFSEDDQTAQEIISNVFTAYPTEHAREQELIVRVSEIIGTLGPEKGASWLEKNYPELYTYFKDTFRPTVDKYLHSPGRPAIRAAESTTSLPVSSPSGPSSTSSKFSTTTPGSSLDFQPPPVASPSTDTPATSSTTTTSTRPYANLSDTERPYANLSDTELDKKIRLCRGVTSPTDKVQKMLKQLEQEKSRRNPNQ
jgi:predicted SprT family Zn-dependent metalloprotease